MARPTVPHCKDCRFLMDFSYGGSLHKCWYCINVDGVILLNRRRISGQEVRTCPRWCPLRLRGYVSSF